MNAPAGPFFRFNQLLLNLLLPFFVVLVLGSFVNGSTIILWALFAPIGVITLLSHIYASRNLLEEIGQGTGRIVEIVKALKSYSYLDQAPVQSIDIHKGLNDTLVILRSKLKDGIEVHRDYAPDLPYIDAFGGELNQVWTNIIDNAIGAMAGQGTLVLKTYKEPVWG